MLVHSDLYIKRCIELGILTDTSIRKYPLRAANLAMIIKAYAIEMHVPYNVDNRNLSAISDYKLYLTDGGLDWFMDICQRHSFEYLRSVFQFVFSKATPEDIKHLDTYEGFRNFRGEIGDQSKAGSKQGAILIRTYGKRKQEFSFDTLHEARLQLLHLSRFYPVDEFTLYRIRKLTKSGVVTHYKEEVPLILKESKRGLNNNLRGTT